MQVGQSWGELKQRNILDILDVLRRDFKIYLYQELAHISKSHKKKSDSDLGFNEYMKGKGSSILTC